MKKVLVIAVAVTVIISMIVAIGRLVSCTVENEEIRLNIKANGIRVALIGDTHFPNCFLTAEQLAALICEQKPDLAVFTGDIADGNATAEDISALGPFFRMVSDICPCFLVIGNHEIGSEYLNLYLETAKTNGIKILLNEIYITAIRGKELAFIGLSDGYLYKENTFKKIPDLSGKVKILLSHRPEKFDEYSACESLRPDVALCGHAHGGLVRLFGSALYAPNQGFLPRYTSGLYKKGTANMVVTRGLGSKNEFRLFNKFHLPVVVFQ